MDKGLGEELETLQRGHLLVPWDPVVLPVLGGQVDLVVQQHPQRVVDLVDRD